MWHCALTIGSTKFQLLFVLESVEMHIDTNTVKSKWVRIQFGLTAKVVWSVLVTKKLLQMYIVLPMIVCEQYPNHWFYVIVFNYSVYTTLWQSVYNSLLISVCSAKCSSTGGVCRSAHQQHQHQCVLGASASQHSEWDHQRIQGETAAFRARVQTTPWTTSDSVFPYLSITSAFRTVKRWHSCRKQK